MNGDERNPAYLWDMLNAAETIVRFVAGRTFQEYQEDDLLRSAVERQIEIIGEAARRVSTSFQTGHSEIPWRGIIAQRNVLAHEYGQIDPTLIWDLANTHVPRLIAMLRPLLP